MGMNSTMDPSAFIEYVCVTDDHLRRGLTVHDQKGHITINGGKWAYCTAARKDEPHEWRQIPPTPLPALRHAEVARTWSGSQKQS